MATGNEYRHMFLRALALHAQRAGKVFACPATWGRLIRATRPNEIWHIDTTLIRLLDGTRVYLQAIIDNYSRRILAWKAGLKIDPLTTVELLRKASENLNFLSTPIQLLCDSGVENVNGDVDDYLSLGFLRRVLAQVEVSYSNSMIEAFWRSLKHWWLYLHNLTTFEQVIRLVAFYVEQHNIVIPHSVFKGQTPDEVYRGVGADIPTRMRVAHALAVWERLARNRAAQCPTCVPESTPPLPGTLENPPFSQLRPENSSTS